MINYINNLYEESVKDNKELKEWIDKLADFILTNYYKMTYVDNNQWKERKLEVVRSIVNKEIK